MGQYYNNGNTYIDDNGTPFYKNANGQYSSPQGDLLDYDPPADGGDEGGGGGYGLSDEGLEFANYWRNSLQQRYGSRAPESGVLAELRDKEAEHAGLQKARADWQIQQGRRNPYAKAGEYAAIKAGSAQAQKVASHGAQSGAAAAFDRDVYEPDINQQEQFAAQQYEKGLENKK